MFKELCICILLLVATPAFAETVIVTATRTAQDENTVTSDVQILTKEELKQFSATDIGAALASVPGLQLIPQGGPGQPQSISIRGAKSEDTLVMIDGVVVNDVMSPAGGFDFSIINPDSIDHIEIIKGAQSLMYGSDALSGVINIITKDNPNTAIHATTGSYATNILSVVSPLISFSAMHSNGYSAADSQLGNSETDGYTREMVSFKKQFVLSENTKLDASANYVSATVDTDARGGVGGDSLGTFTKDQMVFASLRLSHYFWQDQGLLSFGAYNSDHNRTDNTAGSSFFNGQLYKEFVQTDFYDLLPKQTLSFGVENESESGTSSGIAGTANNNIAGAYAQDQLKIQAFDVIVGLRTDQNSQFNNATTYRAGIGYWILPQILRWKSNYGTGFKAPSLYQLYSSYGNTGLQPSQNQSVDTGFELWAEFYQSEINFFRNRYQNYIDFNLVTQKYANVSEMLTQGFEWTNRLIFKDWQLANSFTQLTATDLSTGMYLSRVAPVQNHASLSYAATARLHHSLHWQYVSARSDNDPITGAAVTMPSYSVWSLHTDFQWSTRLALDLQIDNLLDQVYEATDGFGTARFSLYAGAHFEL